MNFSLKSFLLFLFFVLSGESLLAETQEGSWTLELNSRGIKSDYTSHIQQLAENWAAKKGEFCKVWDESGASSFPADFELTPHLVDSDDIEIGFTGKMKIKAPIDKVIWAISDQGQSKIVHFQYNEVESQLTDEKLIELKRVKFISLFKFSAAHTIYYQIFKNKDRAIVKWQLKEKDSVLHSDGVFFLNMRGDETDFCQLSVYRAKFGPAALFPKKIWKESYLGALMEGNSIRVRAENPELSLEDHTNKVKEKNPQELDYRRDIKSRNKPLPFEMKRG